MDQPEERGLPREIQNLLILVYADQTNRSFVRYGGNYTPSLDDLPNELELQEQTLPDLKDWEEAVTRVADIFGHAISRLLNASNLATLASKVDRERQGVPARLRQPPRPTATRAQESGRSPKQEAVQADRVKTAKAVKALLASCDGKEPTKLVGAIAQARLETNSHDDGSQPEVGEERAGMPAVHPLGSLHGGRRHRGRSCRERDASSSGMWSPG